ncbi:HRDC domain-containing protein [Niameybacter massiliensis]|uniref:HRDC domain-containing protein n=1 Tax=Niameybacter massiliensis TaxID=1658108 RepID=UPI0006B473F3|nr:HRDC domain-containing protein [Niameybacter massiliensis]
MGIFDKMKEPIFLKEGSSLRSQLEEIRALESMLNAEGQALLRQDIKCLEYGLLGEQNIVFELKHSHMPMYILQDLYLEDGELSAQIDFLIITRKINFIVECKNLYGDIEINAAGDFIRTMDFGGKKKKEGIYSPVTQNQRHLELLKKLKSDRQKNIVMRKLAEKYFESVNKSIVVLANPKTVLNNRYAKKEVKEQVIRLDQLITYIKEAYKASKEPEISETQLFECANSYLRFHQDKLKTYTGKYEPYKIESKEVCRDKKERIQEDDSAQIKVYQALKQYRLEKSREEGIKPYFIYNNAQLEDLIWKAPKTLEEIQQVSGFGEVKVNKYGQDILKIFKMQG